MLTLVRPPPASTFQQCLVNAQLYESGEVIDVQLALEQWARYAQTVEERAKESGNGDQVLALAADARYPDCCFVEDTCIVAGDTVLICRLGHPSRRGEIDAVVEALTGKNEEAMRIVLTSDLDADATVDGGDVLYTGRHLFVGLSKRTNEGGVRVLQKVFGGHVPVVPVPVPTSELHLKGLVTALTRNQLVMAKEASAHLLHVCPEMRNEYSIVCVPDTHAANVVAIPSQKTLLIQHGYPESEAVLRQAAPFDWAVFPLEMSENAKANGCLTCLSVFVPSQFDGQSCS